VAAVVAVGAFGVAMIQAGQQRMIVERVWALDGYVAREGERPGHSYTRPTSYRALFGDEFMNPVFAVRLAETNATESDLICIARLKRLEYLDLTNTQINDEGLSHLAGLEHLEVLVLNGTLVSDVGLANLSSCTALRVLSLEETTITDVGLETLVGLGSLQWLNLGETRITDVGLRQLADCRSLQTLVIEGCDVSTEGVASLTAALPHIEVYDASVRRPFFSEFAPEF